MNYNPETKLKCPVSNVIANGWISIGDDEHTLYWVKYKSSLYVHVFSNKLKNRLILYLEGQKRNLSNRISKLEKPQDALNLKVIQSIFHPDQLHSNCHFPKEEAEYLFKRINNVKDKQQNHGEGEFYTDNYEPGEVALGWIKEYT